MANWATVNYAIEGPENELNQLYHAIMATDDRNGNGRGEYEILKNLGIDCANVKHENGSGLYLRGSINNVEWLAEGAILSLSAEEEWGVGDFKQALLIELPHIKVYYAV